MDHFPAERTAVVTGAASRRGIGRAAAERLARDGWAVGLIDVDEGAIKELAGELTDSYGVPAAAVGVDVSDNAAVRDAVDQLEERLPQLVALANVAGVSSPAPYLELTPVEWHRVIDINLNGVHFVSRRVAESLVRGGGGRIVSISSVSAQRGGGTYSKSAYSVAKAGVIGLTRALARELGPHGVTVNAIAPGPIDTDIMGGTLSDERKAALVEELLVDRVGTTADIASAIAYLAGEESGYITGQTLNVDGGLYMH
ncbi:short-chain dehydrogenase/reductase SDR [Beutenbergia cavernae DSM 12333]|uniref:Short-chain dehydrogenase/reductase SDR n=1 Tax=Beutenbergia cavernae (strain ATCC BAA-8 / DSM 12333 / CCUG 43141 / JCM 11478 / NBRC 16432 / NCIMB 13614 / HKI 0122) TaxID=471853 RepID=C5C3A1_BEUC1|nr:SDR family NAD(P)-dependent oxidoreductase [Beutenbergia cavernae]ACQ79800.1 short-chain dehydrogenase/reductase SDR [Beutenbergia cavernae DSM 12333]